MRRNVDFFFKGKEVVNLTLKILWLCLISPNTIQMFVQYNFFFVFVAHFYHAFLLSTANLMYKII